MLSILYLVLKHGLYLKTKEIQNVNPDDLIRLLAYFVYQKEAAQKLQVQNEDHHTGLCLQLY